MSEVAIGAVCLIASLLLIQTGMHIGIALMLLSFIGVWAIKSLAVAGKLLASSVSTSIASDAYAVIPMFVLMGLFVSATNMGRDTFDVAALVLRRLRGARHVGRVGNGDQHRVRLDRLQRPAGNRFRDRADTISAKSAVPRRDDLHVSGDFDIVGDDKQPAHASTSVREIKQTACQN